MIETMLRSAWQAWLGWPIDQRLLSIGAVLFATGFMLLFWTPLGNRPIARYCFALALLTHMLAWGVARQFASLGGTQIVANDSRGETGIEMVLETTGAEGGSVNEQPSDGLLRQLLDPRDSKKSVNPEPPPPVRTADPTTLAQEAIQPNRPVPEISESFIPRTAPMIRESIPRPMRERAITPEKAPELPETKPTREPIETRKLTTFRPHAELSLATNQQNDDPMIPDAGSDRGSESTTLQFSVPSPRPIRNAEDAPELPPEAPSNRTAKTEPKPNHPKTQPSVKRNDDRLIARANDQETSAPAPVVPTPWKNRGPESLAMAGFRGVTGSVTGGLGRGRDLDFAPSAAPVMNDSNKTGSPVGRRGVGPEGDLARQRSSTQRSTLLDRFGGNRATEQAVEDALIWLAAHQESNGRWDGDGFMSHCPAGDRCDGRAIEGGSDVGVSGLAILAFLGAGHTHAERGPFQETVRRGLNWILMEQHPDGDLTGKDRQGRIYSHAIATLAITEAYQLTGDDRIKPFAEKAVSWLVRAQQPELGGWRYAPRVDSDTSVFGWAIMALASAKQAGFSVPDSCWDKAQTWLPKVSSGEHGGLACYQPGRHASPSMTAEALVCRQLFGLPRSSNTATEAVLYMLQHPPSRSDYNLYYWYYGTFAMIQVGGPNWERWNNSLQPMLLETQRRSGHAKGSWDPQSPFGVDGGRVFSTAASALCLEVYYRYLPIYRETSASASVSN